MELKLHKRQCCYFHSFIPDMAQYDSAKNTVYIQPYYYIHYKLIIKVICFKCDV